MADDLWRELAQARAQGVPCVLATVVEVRGSAPRAPGAKALIFADGRLIDTVGGGKFESLVVADALAQLQEGTPRLKTYPLHEHSAASFGAICGGEVTVFLEPLIPREAMLIVGAGHCGLAIARLARECGFEVTLLDDRSEWTERSEVPRRVNTPAPEFFAQRKWKATDAVVIVSRNFEIDREALAAALKHDGAGYLGMIGSRRKVTRVFEELRARGYSGEQLNRVHAPIGLPIGADSPMEIAVSVVAQVMQVLRTGEAASANGK